MAIVGSAYVVIRALTDKLQSDIQQGLSKSAPQMKAAGQSAGKSFNQGFNNSGRADVEKPLSGSEAAGRKSGESAGSAWTRSTAEGIRRGSGSVASASGGAGGRAGRAFSSGFNRSGASRTFISIGLRIAALVPILGALVGALSNVVSGLFAVASAATSAAQSLVVIPSLLGAIVQGGIVALASFQGVGKAVQAGFKAAQGTGAKATASMAKQATGAHRAVRDASRGIKEAQQAASEGIRSALRGVQDAQRSYKDALKEEKKAQDDLNDARKEAKERLEELQFAAEDGALAERRASMELADARWELNAASQLPPDNRLRQEAQLAYDEAAQNLKELKEKNGDNAEELKNVKKQGINGMDEVVAAQERLQNAQQGVRDALRGVADAERALAQARKNGAEQVSAAKRALADARVQQQGINADMAAGGTAGQAYTDALKNLSPAAQQFVKYLISIRDNLLALRDAGARGLFPGLEASLRTLVTGLFPTLEHVMFNTGQAIGSAAQQIAKDMTSGPFVSSFRRVTDQNATTIRRLGFVMGDLVRIIVAVLDASRPMVNQFTKWFVGWAQGLRVTAEMSNKTGAMTTALGRAGDRMKVIIGIAKDLIEGFYDIGKVAAPFGGIILAAFKKSTEAFANFTDKVSNRQKLHQFFSDTTTNFLALSSLLKEVGAAFLRLGSNPALAQLYAALEPTVRKIENLLNTMMENNGQALVAFVNSIIDVFTALSAGPGLSTFLGTMTGFFNTLTRLLNGPAGPAVKFLIKLGAAMYAISIIRKFPGMNLLDKGLGALVAKNAEGVRGFTRLKDAMVTGVRAIATAEGRAILIEKVRLAMVKAQLFWGNIMAKAAKAWAVAQRILNAAMEANPFLVIVTGITLVVGALILAYKKFKWFHDLVNKIFDGIKWAFEKVVDAAKWLYDVLFGHSIFPDLLKGFQYVFGAIGKVVQLYVMIVMDVVRLWVAFFQHVVFPVVRFLYTHVFAPIFRSIGRVVRLVWSNVIRPAFVALHFYISKVLIPVVRFLWNNVVKPVFTFIGRLIRNIWNNQIKPVLQGWKIIISSVLIPVIRSLWSNVVKPVFNFIGDKIHNVWVNLIKPAFQAIKNFIDNKLVPAFSSVKSAIVSMWNKIRDAAKAPIRFVVETIYNNGLRKALNKIPGVKLGEAHVDFAKGGVLPGYSPGRDIHNFYSPTAGRLNLSGGEAIMRPEWTRAVGGSKAVKEMNERARKGVYHFAGGGVFRPVKGGSPGHIHDQYTGFPAVDVAVPVGRTVYAGSGGRVTKSYDIRGYEPRRPGAQDGYRSYGRVIQIMHKGFSTLYAHLSRRGVSVGKVVIGGQPIGASGNTGNSTGPHLHFGARGVSPLAFFGKGSILSPIGGGFPTVAATKAEEKVHGLRSVLSSLLGFPKKIAGFTSKLGKMGAFGKLIKSLPKYMIDKGVGWGKKKLGGLISSAVHKARSLAGAIGNVFTGGGGSVREQVQRVASQYGWGKGAEWGALGSIINAESGWNPRAANPNSSARGLFQKMTSIHGPLEKTVGGQTKWGLNYIKGRYGDPIRAWSFHKSHGWYDNGGIARGKGWVPKNVNAPERVLSPRQTEVFERMVAALERRGSADGGLSLSVQVPQDASARDVIDGIVYEWRRSDRGGRYNR